MNSPSISLIIPAYNEQKYIRQCLKHIQRFAPPNLKEIIVVDNRSTDKTAEFAKEFKGVRVVREARRGTTSARQRGVEESSGDIVVFVDADCRIHASWFSVLLREFSQNTDMIALSGPYEFYDVSSVRRALHKLRVRCITMPFYFLTRCMAIGGNLAIRRSALQDIGGFDTSIPFYGDDTNIARRLADIGPIKFTPAFTIRTSARRAQQEGFVKLSGVYAINYLWEFFLHKPFTYTYRNFR